MTDLHFATDSLNAISATERAVDFGLVLYTDGGSDLQAGLGGWGVHGYTYAMEEDKKNVFSKQKGVPSTLGFADGRLPVYEPMTSSSRLWPVNMKLAKTGLLPYPNNAAAMPVVVDHVIELYGSIDKGKVNACELQAMIRAFQLITITRPTQAAIIADSEYTLRCLMQYCNKWQKNGWQTQDGPVKNLALVQLMWTLYNDILHAGVTRLMFSHVYSHTGDPGNEAADALATRGKIRCRALQRKDVATATREFTETVMRIQPLTEQKAQAKTMVASRLYEQRYWYGLCNRGARDWGPLLEPYHVYLLGDHGKMSEPEMIGVELATSSIAAFIARQAEPVFDGLQRMLHEEYFDGVSRVTLGYLPHITKKDRYAKLLADLPTMVFPAGDRQLMSDDGAVLMEKLSPTWNGYRLVDELERLVRLGEEFLVSPETLVLTDVTDQILERHDNGKKVEWKPRSNINPPNGTVKLKVRAKLKGAEYDEVICKLGTDIPSRNTLAAIAGEETRVYVITIRTSGSSYLYYGLVHCPEGLLVTASLTANHVIRKGPSAT